MFRLKAIAASLGRVSRRGPSGALGRKLCLAVVLALAVPHAAQSQEATFPSAQAAASQLSAQQIANLQEDLAWAGMFSEENSPPVSGIFYNATYQAIRQYQRSNNLPETGAPSAALVSELDGRVASIRRTANLKTLENGVLKISYPAGVLTKQQTVKGETRYTTPSGDALVQLINMTGSRERLDQMFADMKKAAGKVKYSVMLDDQGEGQPTRFVIVGGDAKFTIYTSIAQKDDAIVGFIASWDRKKRPDFRNSAIVMGLSIRSKTVANPYTAAAAGQNPKGTIAMPTAELNRQLDICAKAKDAAEIVTACTAALSASTLLAANRPTVLYNRSVGYNRQNKADLALADLDQAIALDPDQASYYTQRGHVRYGQSKYDAAVADYSQALAKKTPAAADYTNRGNSYYGLEDYQKAVADYDASLRLDPNDIDTHALRGSALLRLSRPAEAMTDLNFTIERGGDKVGAGDYKNRGEALAELGRAEEGRPDFAKAEAIATAKIETDNYNFVYRAFVRAFTGNAEGAIADADKYLSIDPKASEALHARALGNVAKQDFTKALADFSQAISMGRKRLFIQRQRGDVYLTTGQPEQAIADYQAQLNLTPGNALAMVGLEKARQAMAAKLLATAGTPQGNDAPATAGSPQVAALAALQPPAKAELGRRVALVIGNSNYANVAALPNPKNDAAKVADTLRKIGFAEVTLAEDTDFRSLNRALQDFASQADGADWAVIYYAGHGIEIANTNYLVPVDAKLASDRDVTFEAVPLDRVMAASEGAKGMRLVILDACRNNPFLANMTRKTATRAVSRGLSRVEPDGGTLVVYAAKAGEVALDGSGGNSPFVTALTTNLQKPGIEIGKLFRLVRDDVMKATDRKQEPFTYGSLPGEDFIFNPG
ncbi:caspase family protein [Labrys portucalensis]|uniref:Caspase family protein n=1 Tax=Labrys neptuniae TaxID=376174 RepID=A0ABV6ZIR2_9HYPH